MQPHRFLHLTIDTFKPLCATLFVDGFKCILSSRDNSSQQKYQEVVKWLSSTFTGYGWFSQNANFIYHLKIHFP